MINETMRMPGPGWMGGLMGPKRITSQLEERRARGGKPLFPVQLAIISASAKAVAQNSTESQKLGRDTTLPLPSPACSHGVPTRRPPPSPPTRYHCCASPRSQSHVLAIIFEPVCFAGVEGANGFSLLPDADKVPGADDDCAVCSTHGDADECACDFFAHHPLQCAHLCPQAVPGDPAQLGAHLGRQHSHNRCERRERADVAVRTSFQLSHWSRSTGGCYDCGFGSLALQFVFCQDLLQGLLQQECCSHLICVDGHWRNCGLVLGSWREFIYCFCLLTKTLKVCD